MKKTFLLFFLCLSVGIGKLRADYTFVTGRTIKIDCSAVVGGVNYPKTSKVGIDYDSDGGGTVISVTFTADVTWTDEDVFLKTEQGDWAKIYFHAPTSDVFDCAKIGADGKSFEWCTYVEPEPLPEVDYVVYFENTLGWENVYVHFYNPNFQFKSNGAAGKKAALHGEMTLVEGEVTTYLYKFSSTVPYTKVCFTLKMQSNYDNFNNNECSWSDVLNLTSNNLKWVPDKTQSTKINGCTYYNEGTWSVAPVTPTDWHSSSVEQPLQRFWMNGRLFFRRNNEIFDILGNKQ